MPIFGNDKANYNSIYFICQLNIQIRSKLTNILDLTIKTISNNIKHSLIIDLFEVSLKHLLQKEYAKYCCITVKI
jgi:hypothetical protein